MRTTEIPKALHICPGCKDLAEGEEYCSTCRNCRLLLRNYLDPEQPAKGQEEARAHAARAHALFAGQPRVQVPMRRRWGVTLVAVRRMFWYGVGFAAFAVYAGLVGAAFLGVCDVVRAWHGMR